MFIWRGKNSRDKRHNLIAGDVFWTTNHHTKDHTEEEQRLCYEREQEHVRYFTKRIKKLMEDYLNTAHGKVEVDLMKKELHKYRENATNFTSKEDQILNERESTKKNFELLYKKFVIKDTMYINSEGIKALLRELKMDMSKKEFESYLAKINLSGKEDVLEFEDFYHGKRPL